MKKKQYAVIGLGRFGSSVVSNLARAGHQVLAIDVDAEHIQKIQEEATHAVVADTTDENVMKELGIRNFDVVIVAIGHDVQASVLTTLILKELGVKYIIAKADSALHGKMLEKVGADRVTFPERDMGARIAHNLISSNVIDFIELAPDLGIVEIEVPQPLVGESLKKSDLRAKYGITIVAIKREKKLILSPDPLEQFNQKDRLVIVGDCSSIQRFEAMDDLSVL